MPLIVGRKKRAAGLLFGFYIVNKSGFGSAQLNADMEATVKGFSNFLLAGPTLLYSVFDYRKNLRGLEYPSEAYIEARGQCHTRTADRLYFLSNHCGGIYLKAG